MSKFSKIVSKVAAASVLLFLAAGASAQTTLRVGASPVPHAEILEFIAPVLAEQGVVLDIVQFTDYVQPNLALAAGELDANYFQHVPYLEQFSADHGLDLVSLGGNFVAPIAIYSKKISSLDELRDGASIAIPNDPTNGGRALLLLQSAGLITLADGSGLSASPLDIVSNPKNLKIVELEAPQLPRTLDDLDASAINTNYALEAGLHPSNDAILIEGAESPYVNVVAVRAGEEDNPAFALLLDALLSDSTRDFIDEQFQGSIVATF